MIRRGFSDASCRCRLQRYRNDGSGGRAERPSSLDRRIFAARLLRDPPKNSVQLLRHFTQRLVAIGTESRCRPAPGQSRSSIRQFEYMNWDWSFDSGTLVRMQHTNRVVIPEHHQHGIAWNFHASFLCRRRRRGFRDQYHVIRGDCRLYTHYQGRKIGLGRGGNDWRRRRSRVRGVYHAYGTNE